MLTSKRELSNSTVQEIFLEISIMGMRNVYKQNLQQSTQRLELSKSQYPIRFKRNTQHHHSQMNLDLSFPLTPRSSFKPQMSERIHRPRFYRTQPSQIWTDRLNNQPEVNAQAKKELQNKLERAYDKLKELQVALESRKQQKQKLLSQVRNFKKKTKANPQEQ